MSAPETQPPLKKITLRTADGQLFDVEEDVAMEFTTVKSFFDENTDATDDIVVPLPNVCADPLVKIIAYCKNHIELKARGESDSKRYDADFVKEQKDDDLKELILASNYLNIKHLLDVLNQEVANRIKNKSVEYVRRFFGIESDFTPEEEAKIRSENAWAFEGVDPDNGDEMQ
ncbi:hypothetical protein SLEP1_g38373 [Rubroshorea leprosula]|nr:hypothetical protein SLEP1_g38373 [Rubroshorea leprosula]